MRVAACRAKPARRASQMVTNVNTSKPKQLALDLDKIASAIYWYLKKDRIDLCYCKPTIFPIAMSFPNLAMKPCHSAAHTYRAWRQFGKYQGVIG
jgi:hypothetical protein